MAVALPRMRELLGPYVGDAMPGDTVLSQIDRYLDLILLWNARTNLTAVRESEAILQRQVGESLFAALRLPLTGTLLDFGSGAGFPGIPIALLRPDVRVTLAESQGKKASFLREAVRVLGLTAIVWSQRVESLPAATVFDWVAMRAVDDSARMLPLALERIGPSGGLVRFLGEEVPVEISGWVEEESVPVPNSKGMLQILTRG